MNRDLLRQIVADQWETAEKTEAIKTLILREGVAEASRALSHPNILLISGMRRSGKSTFSHQIASKHPYAAINFDDERLLGFKTEHFNLLLQVFSELRPEFKYLLFDEIQNIPGWELFTNRIRANHKVIITGSNANLLSSELSTHLTGRFDAISLFPMSWKEYLSFIHNKTNPLTAYSSTQSHRLITLSETFLCSGGIFEYYSLGKEHIRTLFGSILHKDILGRYHVSYPHVLEELSLLLITGFASKLSVNKLAAHFRVKSPHTIKEYLQYLENTFLVFSISKWSYKLREQQSAAKKVYCADNGIIDALSFSFSSNKGRLLENAVAIELKRKCLNNGDSVHYWDDYHNECDFIIKKGTQVVSATQVCYEITEENSVREKNGLLKAMEHFDLKEGTIVTLGQSNEEVVGDKVIRTIPFFRWA
jgi:predicted AAA+ superfamily ATPase